MLLHSNTLLALLYVYNTRKYPMRGYILGVLTHIFHSHNIPNNFYLWRFVISLQEWKLVFGRTEDGQTEDGRIDRCGSWNSYLDCKRVQWNFKTKMPRKSPLPPYINHFLHFLAISCLFPKKLIFNYLTIISINSWKPRNNKNNCRKEALKIFLAYPFFDSW